jgi:hypothetical protein
MARLYNIDKLRRIVGEDDVNNETTNKRLREAGELAQAEYEIETANITVTVTEKIKELINFGAVAYFYQLENGDETLTTKYTIMLEKAVKTIFGRPNMETAGPL